MKTLYAHQALRALGLGRPTLTDLRRIEAPRLESLSVAQTRTLVGLDLVGVESLGPFENDDAVDWRYLLVDGGGPEVVGEALRAVAGVGSPERPEAANAVAAATVVGAGLGVTGVELPEDVADWLAAVDPSAWPPLAAEAVRALDSVLADSELRELWDEAGDVSWGPGRWSCAPGSTRRPRVTERLRPAGFAAPPRARRRRAAPPAVHDRKARDAVLYERRPACHRRGRGSGCRECTEPARRSAGEPERPGGAPAEAGTSRPLGGTRSAAAAPCIRVQSTPRVNANSSALSQPNRLNFPPKRYVCRHEKLSGLRLSAHEERPSRSRRPAQRLPRR